MKQPHLLDLRLVILLGVPAAGLTIVMFHKLLLLLDCVAVDQQAPAT
jgi:hypothetical protein